MCCIYMNSPALSGCQPHFRQLYRKKNTFAITRICLKPTIMFLHTLFGLTIAPIQNTGLIKNTVVSNMKA